jgi:NADH pyrophosphatase NudC (nudix superfamily)
MSYREERPELQDYVGDDAINAPSHRADRPSARHCPHCGRRVKYLMQDRVYYCKACELELEERELK